MKSIPTAALTLYLTGALTLLLNGCASVRVESQSDPSVDFASYRTFAQLPPPKRAANLPGYSEITGRQMQAAIAEDLESKGLEPASPETADLIVSFSIDGQPRQEVWSSGGYGWYGGGDVWTTNYVEGTLIISMVDRARKRVVWHTWGTKDIFKQTDGSGAVEAVKLMMKKYPPEPPKSD